MEANELRDIVTRQRAVRPNPPVPSSPRFDLVAEHVSEPPAYTPPPTSRVGNSWHYRQDGRIQPWGGDKRIRIGADGRWQIRCLGRWYGWRALPCRFAGIVTPELDDETAAQLRRLGRDPGLDAWTKFIAGVGRRWRTTSFESLRVDHDGQDEAIAAVRQLVADPAVWSSANLILVGPCGAGKDALALAAARELIERHGVRVVYARGTELKSGARAAMHNGNEAGFVDRLSRAQLLIISDPIGAGGTLTDFVADTLLQIIDTRWNDQRPTWITLNTASGEDARTKMGPAAYDRLRDGAVIVSCNWVSYRGPRHSESQVTSSITSSPGA